MFVYFSLSIASTWLLFQDVYKYEKGLYVVIKELERQFEWVRTEFVSRQWKGKISIKWVNEFVTLYILYVNNLMNHGKIMLENLLENSTYILYLSETSQIRKFKKKGFKIILLFLHQFIRILKNESVQKFFTWFRNRFCAVGKELEVYATTIRIPGKKERFSTSYWNDHLRPLLMTERPSVVG